MVPVGSRSGHRRNSVQPGRHVHKGEGIPPNFSEAVKWFRKAADQNYAAAQYNLGIMYLKGEGVSPDSSTAVKWYRQAAEQGVSAAQYAMGAMYARGEGVDNT